jgi:LysR family transcriptional regulator, nod-box dependent transcriptional activator
MDDMRLNRFDLNLLVALDALLTEQNTTRAGKRINLSQPAMSCALARLRSYFNDPILTQWDASWCRHRWA